MQSNPKSISISKEVTQEIYNEQNFQINLQNTLLELDQYTKKMIDNQKEENLQKFDDIQENQNISEMKSIQKQNDEYNDHKKHKQNKKDKKNQKKDKHNEKDKHNKKDQKKSKKRKRSRSYSKSSDSSSLSRKRYARRLEKDHLRNLRQNMPVQRPRVLTYNLGNIIKDQQKTNYILDTEEVSRANVKFKQIDHSERKSQLLSSVIQQKRQDDYYMAFINGEYSRQLKPFACSVANCSMRFITGEDLVKHMEIHKKQQEKYNDKKADEFAKSLFEDLI